MFFNCMKAEHHLELINSCMHLLVGRENDCSGSNIPQNRGFHAWLPNPPLVVWSDLYKNHIGFIYYFNLLPLSYNVSLYKDQNQNRCVIGYVNVQKMSFSHFWPFYAELFFFVTMATCNNLREHSLLKL